ncbi:MAG TPA: TonB-dependent receptor, partial [Caulobacteraceae bacterium]
AYVKFSRGYKAGGFNAYLITPPYAANESLAFQPEYLNNYEAGYKGSWFDSRVSLTGSVFYDDYTNKQEAVEDPLALSITIRNAASATIYGGEFEGAVKPLRGLTLSGTLGLLHARYNSFPNGGGLGISYTGNDLPSAPSVQATLAAEYAHEFPGWAGVEGVARLEAIYQSSSFADPNNTAAYRQNPATFLNGRVGIQNPRWGLYLWGNNLTNDFHLSGGLYELVATARAVNIPRNFGVELNFKY